MNTLKSLIVAAALLAAPTALAAETSQEFQVDDMKSFICEMKVQNRVTRLDGVLDAEADHKTDSVVVTYDDDAVNTDMVLGALGTLKGYAAHRPEATADAS